MPKSKHKGRPAREPRRRVLPMPSRAAVAATTPLANRVPAIAPSGVDILQPRDAQATTWPVPLLSYPGKSVMVRRTDMLTLFMSNTMSLKLLANMSRLEEIQSAIKNNPASIDQLTREEKAEMEAWLDRVAIEVVCAPLLVDDVRLEDATHMHVSRLTMGDKLTILKSVNEPPPGIVPAPIEVSDRAVSEFREQPTAARNDGDASLHGASLRPGTIIVDAGRRGKVEVAGA